MTQDKPEHDHLDISRRQSLREAQHQVLQVFSNDPNFFLNEPGYEQARVQKLKNCCKRVRTWRKQATNPLLVYRSQFHGETIKKERRIHVAVLLNMILDAYEVCITHYDEVLRDESFPEYFANSIIQKSNGRKNGVDQMQATIATIQSTISHPRIRVFSNLCGLNTDFNPAEKSILYLRCVEKIYRIKLRDKAVYEDITSVASVVFHNIGLTQSAAKVIIHELFNDPDPFWTFQYLHGTCDELKVNRSWPSTAEVDLIDQLAKMISPTRGMRKIDGDSFLELLIQTWNQRAELLYHELDLACDLEEASAAESLRDCIEKCDFEKIVLPLAQFELDAFASLVDDFWLADIPWSDRNVQEKYLNGFTRHEKDIQRLYLEYRSKVSKVAWTWETWEWESEWDWGALELARPNAVVHPLHVVETGQLNLSHFGLGDRVVQKMGQFLDKPANRQLKTLVLRDNAVSNKGCESIVKAIVHQQHAMVCLDLSHNNIQYEGVKAISDALESPHCKLQTLILSKNELGDRSGRLLLAGIANNITLRSVDLASNRIEKCGPAFELVLRTHPKLRHLDLSWNILRSNEAIALAAGLCENNGLEELNLSYNALGESGFSAIVQALTRNMALKSLNLAHNNIDAINDLPKVVKNLRTNSTLHDLNLNGNPFGIQVATVLEAMNEENYSASHVKGSIHSVLSVSLDGCTFETLTTYLLPKATEDEDDDR